MMIPISFSERDEEYISDMEPDAILEACGDQHTIDTDAEGWRDTCVGLLMDNEDQIGNIYENFTAAFFDRVNERFLQQGEETPYSNHNSSYCCQVCGKHLNHPDHLPECEFRPQTINFNVCANCDHDPDHPDHHPSCRAHVLAPLLERMVPNHKGICFRCRGSLVHLRIPCSDA